MIYQVEINEYGDEYWRYNGKLHREGDKPAIIRANGTVLYHKNGELHRDSDKPAVIYTNGSVEYWKNGKLHRDGDKPATIYATGSVFYYKNGVKYTPSLPCEDKIVEIDGHKYKLVKA